ncbi:MAG TPA: hypothetical protein K8V84_25180 [Nocardiopsis listeri]|uniref:DUF6924 domain-containing protein n=1 Tax=Nocardiopsis listeri TaxID=53440 RepID=UPI001DF578ED|nr:hypothetical protein [Nocardiopsis listeri]HJE61777.1 hypothetical protein [Nocardiopsis listeri]
MRPPSPLFLPSLPTDEEIPGFLVVRTAHDDQDAWQDTLSYLADLPGVLSHPSLSRPEHGDPEAVPPQTDKRLLLVDDPAWRNATTAKVHSAMERAGPWRPDLVLPADDRTTADPVHRPSWPSAPPQGPRRLRPRRGFIPHWELEHEDGGEAL